MRRFLGRAKAKAPEEEAPKPSLEDVSKKMGGRGETLDQKIAALNAELKGFNAQLKRAKGPAQTTIKKRALAVLKRKKMYEQQRDQLMAQQFNVDQAAFAIETAKDTQVQVEAMRGAASALQAETAKMPDIDDIDDTIDDLAEQFEEMNEIQESLGRSYGVGDDVDELDLDDELAALEDEFDMDALGEGEADATPAYLQPPPAMPVAPSMDPVPAGGGGVPAAVAAPGTTDEFGLPVAGTVPSSST